MNTEQSQLQLFAASLRDLALQYPGLFFEDRQNPEHLAAYDEWNTKKTKVTRPAKPCGLEWARFQAWRPVVQRLNLPALKRKNKETNEIEVYRYAVKATVTFRRLVAWASNPKRLGEILAEKGVR